MQNLIKIVRLVTIMVTVFVILQATLCHFSTVLWGETGGSETPASRTFYFRFPPLFVGVPASLFYVDCKMLRNITRFFSLSPGSRYFGNPASRPFSSRLPYPSRPYSPGLTPPCPPPLYCAFSAKIPTR